MKTQIRLFDDQGLTEATPHAESVELQIRAIENSAFPFEELSKIARTGKLAERSEPPHLPHSQMVGTEAGFGLQSFSVRNLFAE